MKKVFILLFMVLLSTIHSCAEYADAILGTDLTFDKKGLTESILNEVQLNEEYFNKQQIIHSPAGTSFDEMQAYVLVKVELQRTHHDNRSTSFNAKYFLDTGKEKPNTHTENRIIYNGQKNSTVLGDGFLETYCLKNNAVISDKLKYYWTLKSIDDSYYIVFGKNMMLMSDRFLDQIVTSTCDIFSKENIPLSYRDYSFVLYFSKKAYFFSTQEKVEGPVEGPISKYKNAIRINFQIAGNDVNNFLFSKTTYEIGLESSSLGTLNDEKVENEIVSLLSGQLKIGRKTFKLSPYITSKMVREVKFK